MNCSISARLELIKVGFRSITSDTPDQKRQLITDAIFWVCDGIEDELTAGSHGKRDYCIGYLSSLTELAKAMFEGNSDPEEFARIDEYCLKVASCSID